MFLGYEKFSGKMEKGCFEGKTCAGLWIGSSAGFPFAIVQEATMPGFVDVSESGRRRWFNVPIGQIGVFAHFRLWTARWRERRVLRELDPRMLHDIGVSRTSAASEAGKPFWRA